MRAVDQHGAAAQGRVHAVRNSAVPLEPVAALAVIVVDQEAEAEGALRGHREAGSERRPRDPDLVDGDPPATRGAEQQPRYQRLPLR